MRQRVGVCYGTCLTDRTRGLPLKRFTGAEVYEKVRRVAPTGNGMKMLSVCGSDLEWRGVHTARGYTPALAQCPQAWCPASLPSTHLQHDGPLRTVGRKHADAVPPAQSARRQTGSHAPHLHTDPRRRQPSQTVKA